MSRRFFSDSPITSDNVELTGSEAQHLAKVMRARSGDEVMLFDGSGFEFNATISAVSRSSVALDIVDRIEVDRELPFELTLAVALPKGDRQRWLVEKLTELGCTRLQPLITARGVSQPTGNALARLRRAVIEASKQCGRNRLMEIAEPEYLGAFLADHARFAIRLFAHPTKSETSKLKPSAKSRNDNVAAVVGPEGGFTSDEAAIAEGQQWACTNLGPRILRAETAAVTICGLLACGQSDV